MLPNGIENDIYEIIRNNPINFHREGLKKEYLLYLIDSIIRSRASQRKEIDENTNGNYYVPLNSRILKSIVPKYYVYLDFLEFNQIIHCDHSFIIGEKSIGYRLNNCYSGRRLQKIVKSCYILHRAINKAALNRNKEEKKSIWGYRYLGVWWDSGKLKIDIKGAYLWIEKYEEKKKLDIISDDKIGDKEAAIRNAIDTTEDFKYLVWALNFKKHRYSFSGEGHRFYNPICNIKSELRSYLTYDGKPLVNIDLKNSQPFLSTALFKKLFWVKDEDNQGKIILNKISKEIEKEITKNKEYNNIIMWIESLESVDNKGMSVKNYIEKVIDGSFYEYIQPYFEEIFPGKFSTRKLVKGEVLRIFYVQSWKVNWEFYEPSKVFATLFAGVYGLFTHIKQIRDNLLPILLQRMESYLMLDVVCKKISEEHPKIPLFTIHDNIITTKGNEAIVKDIMCSEIEKLIGYKPRLDYEYLTPPELWESITGYEGYYEISNFGNVRGLERKVSIPSGSRKIKSRTIKKRINNCGYWEVRLSKNGKVSTKFIHSLIANAFLPNPGNKSEVNHKNGNKSDNSLQNLEFVSHAENMKHASKMGLCKKKIKHTPVLKMHIEKAVA